MRDFLEYISIDAKVRFGKPCIKNTRIAVLDILQWLASGMSVQDILEDYPILNDGQIRAALAYAAHRGLLTKLSAA